jgi:hypothetical protein
MIWLSPGHFFCLPNVYTTTLLKPCSCLVTFRIHSEIPIPIFPEHKILQLLVPNVFKIKWSSSPENLQRWERRRVWSQSDFGQGDGQELFDCWTMDLTGYWRSSDRLTGGSHYCRTHCRNWVGSWHSAHFPCSPASLTPLPHLSMGRRGGGGWSQRNSQTELSPSLNFRSASSISLSDC